MPNVKVETMVKNIENYIDNNFDVELLKKFNDKPGEDLYSVSDLINDEVDKIINETELNMIFDVEDLELRKTLLRKILYVAFLSGLGEDAETMMLKCIIKLIEDAQKE